MWQIRLAKYAERGFEVACPELDRAHIDPQLFERRFSKIQGMARLLLLERFRDEGERHRFKLQQRLKKLRPEETKDSFWALLSDEFKPQRLCALDQRV